MGKPPKIPKPQKPAILPPNPNVVVDPTIGMQQERLIGRFVVTWAKLEAAMEDLIWHLLGLEMKIGRHLTARMDATAKIKIARQIGEIDLSNSTFEKLSPTLDRIDNLRDDRNAIIHGAWGRTTPEGIPMCVSLRTKPLAPDQVVSETYPTTRMYAMIDEADLLKWELVAIMKEIRAMPGKSAPNY